MQWLLKLPPHGWLLAGVRQFLPAAAKTVLKRGLKLLSRSRMEGSDAEPPLFLPNGQLRALYASKTHIRIDKAREKLGYNPAFDLHEGMARTAAWARGANLLTS